jgi:hypothetical protein
MSPDQPTNQPTANSLLGVDTYLGLRIKVGHDKLDVILSEGIHDVKDYCLYKHNTSGEHFHICLPALTKVDTTSIGKQVLDNLGSSGNGGYSIKLYSNGVSSFVFYSGHEGTAAIYENEEWESVIEGTTTYYVKQTGQTMLPLASAKGKDQDSDWQ